MDWADVGTAVAKAAPLLGSLLGGPAGGAAGGLIARALGVEASPDAVTQTIQADPQALERVRRLEREHERELARMYLEAETARLVEINKTMRVETTSEDAYVRRWRPTYGYATAATWFIQMNGLVFILGMVAYRDPEMIGTAVGALGSVFTALLGLWGIALSVLGVNISKRSADKQVNAGQQPSRGLIGALAERLKGGNT